MKRKTPLLVLFCGAFALPSSLEAQPPSKSGGAPERLDRPAAEPAYREESPLPAGWPAPGPFNQVVLKKYPAYRAAFTTDNNPNAGFWTLFKHIERQGIPMTAPVEMKLDDSGKRPDRMERMAFLYQSTEVGTTGADGTDVEVRDVPAAEALSYAWQGPRSRNRQARELLEAELEKRGLEAASWRLLGYNSPFVPRSRQTHELQAVLAPRKP